MIHHISRQEFVMIISCLNNIVSIIASKKLTPKITLFDVIKWQGRLFKSLQHIEVGHISHEYDLENKKQ